MTHTPPPPVSPTPAADALHTLSPPNRQPQSTCRAAAGWYTAGGVTPLPKRHRQPRRRSHQRRRRGYSTLLLPPPPDLHQSAEPPPAFLKPAAARRVPSATHTLAAGLTSAGGGVATTNPCPAAGPDRAGVAVVEMDFPPRLQSQSRRRPNQYWRRDSR